MAPVVAAGLLAGACGGGQEAVPAPEAPALARPLAEELATQADQIAAAYDAGDVCGAAQQADALQEATVSAIASGEVPPAMREELQTAVSSLAGKIECVEEDEDENKGKGKGKGRGKGKGNGEGDD